MPNFYGKSITTLHLFGQKRWGDCSPGRVTGTKIFHGAGVVVDRNSTPNHIYAVDSGNSRILGFRSFGSTEADVILGQPNQFTGAPNGDCNIGMYGPPSRNSLCLMGIPMNTNLGEQWMRLNIDVDADGRVYVPDFYNNRVLIYPAPFDRPIVNPPAIIPPLGVLGQPDFESNGINRGQGPGMRDAESLFLSFRGDHVSARGVSVDPDGNRWVADTFNYRVLRFPKRGNKANLVLGQPDFVTSDPADEFSPATAPLDRMYTPILARINPDTGELYVIDEYSDGFRARILVFEPPFINGMAAARVIFPQQPPIGDYANSYQLTHATGLVFNPVKTDDWIDEMQTHRYRDGVFWLHDSGPNGAGKRTLLLDAQGTILLAIGAPNLHTFGGQEATYSLAGMNPQTPFNLIWPGGMLGFDSQNNIYLADDVYHRVARYSLPYRVGQTQTIPPRPKLPATNGGLFPGTLPNTFGPAHCSGPSIGAITFRGQLIVRDTKRYMVWNNYLSNTQDGPPADIIVGQASGSDISQANSIYGGSHHTIDQQDRMWACSVHGQLLVYQLPMQLPMTQGTQPLREIIPLFWVDEPQPERKIDYFCNQALAFERSRVEPWPDHPPAMWVYDIKNHRLLRIKNPDNLNGQLFVDVVIGQKNKTDGGRNGGDPNGKPSAATFGNVGDIRFDRLGNLFVVDNSYECSTGGGNGRIIVFMAADLRAIPHSNVVQFPNIQAKKVYVVDRFDETNFCRIHDPVERPHSPVSVAFNSRNQMVVGNDGYYRTPKTRHLNQLYLYQNPLNKRTPDALIELPLGAPGELSFDENDNLIVQDHTWNKIWVINYDTDPAWLRPLP